jgi:hypothetical protein
VPPLTISEVTNYEALSRIAHHSDFRGGSANWCIAIAANSIRSWVTASPEGLATVTIRKMLRERISLTIPKDIMTEKLPVGLGAKPDVWDEVMLSRLYHLGDIVQDEHRRWHGAPVRLVHLGSGAAYATILGGLPTSDAEEYLGCRISVLGHLRFIVYNDLSSAIANSKTTWQTYDNWLRLDARNIVQWTTAAVEAAIAKAQTGAPFGVEDYEVLALRNSRFFWRPVNAIRTSPTGPHLCRSLLPGSQTKKEYWLALFAPSKGSVVVAKSAIVAHNVGTRLALGIPKYYGVERSVKYLTTEQLCSVILREQVPYPERHLLNIALRDEGRAYVWPVAFFPVIEAVLRSLGFDLTFQDER